jgi:ABC-2 type transport system ATP-binding protein
MEAIRISNLAMSYNSTPVFSQLSTSIEKGRVVALLGRNGAGKSTLLKILNGQLSAVSGEASVNGLNPAVSGEQLRQGCVMVNEECHLYPWMTPIMIAELFSGMYVKWNQAQYEELLKKFGIDSHRRISTFSKGTRRKLQLAFALATEPEILLLDEPVGSIDVVAREEILTGIIDSLIEKGVTVVISSHELNDISGVCDHVLILSEGRLAVDCSRDELADKIRRVIVTLESPAEALPSHPSFISARANGCEMEIVVKNLDETELNKVLANFRIRSVKSQGMSLEELFKAVTRHEKHS